MKLPWVENTKGHKSASLTMVIVSFAVVTLWILFWLIGTSLGLTIPPFDVTTAMGYLSPLLMLYFGRRWSGEAGENSPISADPIEKLE